MTSTTQAEELTDKNLEAYITRLVSEKGDDVSLPVDALTNSFGENLKLMLAGGEMREYFENACKLQGQDVDVVLKKLDSLLPEVNAMHKAIQQSQLEDEELSEPQGSTAVRLDIANWTPLLFATYDGAIDDVKAIVAQEGDAAIHHALKSNGVTPIFLASKYGHFELVTYLVDHGAKLDTAAADGFTSLHTSARNGHLEVVTYLVDHGAAVDAITNEGHTALHLSALNGHLEVVTLLAPLSSIDQATNDGSTAFVLAALGGHVDVLAFLVESGTNDLATISDGQTALHVAAAKGHLSAVKFILGRHEYAAYESTCEVSPLVVASRNGHLEVVQFLVQDHGAKFSSDGSVTELGIAAYGGHVELVRFLIQAGASVEASTDDGTTPLFAAIMANNAHYLDVVEVLVSLGGANLQAQLTTTGETVLHYAAGAGRLDATRFLLGKGAAVDTTDASGATPLFLASQHGKWAVVNALLTHGANVDVANAEGTTPLIVAAEKGDILIVKELLGKDASISLQNKAGKTARDVALANKHAAVVTAIDESQLTGPKLYQAVYRNDIDAVRALLERGADPTWKTVAGKMPIDIARGDPAILALLEERIAANNTAKPKGTKETKRPKAKENKCQIM
ncbi:hypothetical protein H257_18065 [Aphanomyces astaci]|uniref:Uncharacterized protein n=1 Tax=Aphanomyces astaci TaxID=112090 RepID=W4FE39_APHAT|nr:hypothetical protein H257_18065 [Aphanomyces astaci]ETV65139.1 hypothetical protein H257_18065 [Aphanomyces astaci]|eukprot:XP_009845377.1 hypothetical protein H257_18065 [Aphanomyces astaci]